MARIKETPKPEAQPAAAPVDPAEILARRKAEKRAAAWATIRRVALLAEMSEADVLVFADAAEVIELSPNWLQVFRRAIAEHATASVAASPEKVAGLMETERAAQALAESKAAALKTEIARLEEESRQAEYAVRRAAFARREAMGQQQIAADICAAFAPLFDSGIGLDGFALPVRADQLPRGIAAELAAAGLVDANGAPVALVAPPEPERPRPQRVPVLRCSNAGPQMTQLPPLRSLSMQLNGRPVEKV